MSQTPTLRLAVAQAHAGLPTPAARFEWLNSILPEIAQEGAELLLLPELFACGYNIGDALHSCAESEQGPTFWAMAELAQRFGVALHYGFAERAEDALYNATLCISPQGTVLSHQRKLILPPGFERDYFTPGQGCDVFQYRGVNIATLICYDAEFPEAVRHVAARGAQLILVPTALGADWPWVAHQMIPTRAYENGVYLAYANSVGVENGMVFLGHSVICAPGGIEAARAGAEPEVIYANLDMAWVDKAQARLPYLQDRHRLFLG